MSAPGESRAGHRGQVVTESAVGRLQFIYPFLLGGQQLSRAAVRYLEHVKFKSVAAIAQPRVLQICIDVTAALEVVTMTVQAQVQRAGYPAAFSDGKP